MECSFRCVRWSHTALATHVHHVTSAAQGLPPYLRGRNVATVKIGASPYHNRRTRVARHIRQALRFADYPLVVPEASVRHRHKRHPHTVVSCFQSGGANTDLAVTQIAPSVHEAWRERGPDVRCIDGRVDPWVHLALVAKKERSLDRDAHRGVHSRCL